MSTCIPVGASITIANIDFLDGIRKPRRRRMSDTFDNIKSIIVELLGVEESKVTSDAKFREDLEADSLDLVELIMAFEEKFGGEISDEDAQKITTVGEAVKYIDEHMG
jgi:acyl carrier protein